MPIEAGKIRNVAVVGHRGTGKTSLVEAMLFQAGAINRLGTVEAGTTTSDWDEDEQRRQMSLASSLAHLDRGARRALVDLERRRPGLAPRHARGPRERQAGRRARRDRDARSACRGDLPSTRTGEARGHALLLRGAHAPRDRGGPRGHRVSRLAASHEGHPAPPLAPPWSNSACVAGRSLCGLDGSRMVTIE